MYSDTHTTSCNAPACPRPYSIHSHPGLLSGNTGRFTIPGAPFRIPALKPKSCWVKIPFVPKHLNYSY